MSVAIQCDLFEEFDEITLLRKEIEIIKKQTANVRRGLFARHNEIAKTVISLQDEIEKLKGKTPEPLEIVLF